MKNGFSCIFIDAPGILWDENTDYGQGVEVRCDAAAYIERLAETNDREVILIVDDDCPDEMLKGRHGFGEALLKRCHVYAVIKATSPGKIAEEIARKIDRYRDMGSFVILSTHRLEKYFPRRTVDVPDGKLDDECMKKVEEILDREEYPENLYTVRDNGLHHRRSYRNGPQKVIFLDIDGVLNKDDGGAKIEEQYVKRLAHIVEETGAEVILSSSWRLLYARCVDPTQKCDDKDVNLLLEMLEKYKLRISGVTPDLTSGTYARPLEIRTWLQEQGKLERFVILDDETFWAWNWLGDYFVCTTHLDANGKYVCGLTDADAEKAIEILNRPLVKYF